jgi:hypothetical protein
MIRCSRRTKSNKIIIAGITLVILVLISLALASYLHYTAVQQINEIMSHR